MRQRGAKPKSMPPLARRTDIVDQPIDPGVLRAARRILDPRQPTATLAEERIARIFEEETNLPAMREALKKSRTLLAYLVVNAYTHEGDDAYIQNAMDEIDAALGLGEDREEREIAK